MDLNLLAVLDALLAERNVTRAARRVGLSQPAASHALQRLRELLKDPLLVRTPRGMIPTKRAEALVEPVRNAIAAVQAALGAGETFDPRTSRMKVTVAATDYAELVLLPRLCRLFEVEAPGVRLELLLSRDRTPVQELEEGRFDIAIGVFDDAPETLFRQTLFRETFVCALREGHPELSRRLTLPRYAALKHALISPFGGMSGVVDEKLKKLGVSREVVVASPHFLVAPLVVAQTDYVLTLPRRVAEALVPPLPLRLVEPPLEIPGFSILQLWHPRSHHDAGLRWFRGKVAAVCAAEE